MKNIFLTTIIGVVFLLSSQASFAQEKMASDEASISPTPTPIEYQLPYPGLLPDSPIYFLKILRDKLIDFLVSNPVKKADLNLLQADKRLAAGIALFEKGKQSLAESTISKGENYFEDALVKAELAKKEGMEIGDIVQRLSLSAKKHRQVLQMLVQSANKDVKGKLQVLEKKMADLENRVEKISK